MLPEKRTDRVGSAMMASTHIYELGGVTAPPGGPPAPVRRGGGGPGAEGGAVELALDPSELDLVDTDAMAVRYEQTLREQQNQLQKEDLSDMLAEHVARQKVRQTVRKYFLCGLDSYNIVNKITARFLFAQNIS